MKLGVGLYVKNSVDAVNLYKQSLGTGELKKDQFIVIFSEDRALLISLGVNPEDLPILLDYLLFNVS